MKKTFPKLTIEAFYNKQVSKETMLNVITWTLINRIRAKEGKPLLCEYFSIEEILIEQTKPIFEIVNFEDFSSFVITQLNNKEDNKEINIKHILSTTKLFATNGTEFIDIFYELIKTWSNFLSENDNSSSTPDNVLSLVSTIAGKVENLTIYNPFGGVGSFSKYLNGYSEFIGEEIDVVDYKIAELFVFAQNKQYNTKYNLIDSTTTNINSDVIVSVLPLEETNDKLASQLEVVTSSLSKKGKAIIVIPGFMFDIINRDSNDIFKCFVDQNILDIVINLPIGSTYKNKMPSTVFVLDNSKKHKGVKFVDVSNLSIGSIDIKDIIKNTNYTSSKNIDYIDGNIILTPWRYADRSSLDKEKSLKTFLDTIDIPKKNAIGLTLIDSTLLDVDVINFYIDISTSKTINHNKKYRVLTESALVVNLVGKFRVGYFIHKGDDVAISDDLNIFSVANLSIDYLSYQLNSSFYYEQLTRYSLHTNMLRVERLDFLESKIVVLNDSERKYWINEQKQLLLKQAEEQNRLLAEKLGLQKTETQILSSVKHSVNQIVGAINSEFLTLKHTVELKDSKQETMSLDDKVSKRDGAKTIIEVFDSVKINLNSIKSIFTTMQKIINIDEKPLNIQPISFRELLIEEAKPLLKDNNQIALYYSFDNDMSNDIIDVDIDLFKEAIRNIITNAIKHSFSSIVSSFNSRKSIGFYLSVSPDKQNIVIDYMNNGDSLPEDFSFDDYVSYGKKFDSKDGSGLGGFITNKVIKKHNGSFINKLDNAQFEGSYNYTRTVDDYTSWSLTYDKLISLNDFYFPTTKNKKEDVLVEFEEYFSYEYDKYEENILISRDIKRGLKIDKIEIDIDALEALIDVNSFELEEFKRESSLNLKLNEFVSEDDLKLIKIQGTFSIYKKELKYSDLYEIELVKRLDDISAIKSKIENLKAELVVLNISESMVEIELSDNLLETKNKIEVLKVEIDNMPDDEYDVIITKPNIHFIITLPIKK